MDKNKKREDEQSWNQCRFQFLGRRCELETDICAERHLIKTQFCEIHQREEGIGDCEFS